MNAFANVATLMDFQQTSRDVPKTPQLEAVVGFEAAPWLPSLLSSLRSLEEQGRDIPGIGDFRVAGATADNVRRLLTVLAAKPLPEPRLAPFAGGGLALICSLGDRELTFTAYPDSQDFIYSDSDENEIVQDGVLTLNHRNRLAGLIASFLTR